MRILYSAYAGLKFITAFEMTAIGRNFLTVGVHILLFINMLEES